MKEFAGWNEIKIETDKTQPTLIIREGEIRWCKVGINVGNEAFGKGEEFIRPVLVLKKFSSDVFLGIPLTSKDKKGSWYYSLRQDELSQTLILNQARLLDRRRLKDKLFEISERELLLIKKAYCNLILS